MSGAQKARRLAQIAAILSDMSHEMEILGASMCADPAFVAAHAEALQAFDHLAQRQRALSELLINDCDDAAVDRLELERLKAKFAA